MRALSLFSGLGGIDLAGEWAGIQTVAFCEREPFPRRVLTHHWPGIPIYDDVCTLTKEVLQRDGIISGTRAIDLVSAGFPCQPFSNAGQRGGTDDERYLWPEVVRVLQEVEPTWFIGENVAGILSMAEPDGQPQVESRTVQSGAEEDFYEAIFTQQEIMLFGNICKDLEDNGFEVQVFVIPAAAVGAKHLRERVFIVANSSSARARRGRRHAGRQERESSNSLQSETLRQRDGQNGAEGFEPGNVMGYTASSGLSEWGQPRGSEGCPQAGTRMDTKPERSSETLADSYSKPSGGLSFGERAQDTRPTCCSENVADSSSSGQQECFASGISGGEGYSSGGVNEGRTYGATQSDMGRSSDELSKWLDGRGVNPLDAFAEYIASYPQPAPLGMDQYSWEPPRVATGVKERTARLKGLGNAVNPLQIYPVLAAVKLINDQIDAGLSL